VSGLLTNDLNQTCSVATLGAPDKNGKRAVSSTATVACRFWRKQKNYLQPDGTMVRTDAELWTETAINFEATITVGGVAYRAVPASVDEWRDLGGTVAGYKVLLGRA